MIFRLLRKLFDYRYPTDPKNGTMKDEWEAVENALEDDSKESPLIAIIVVATLIVMAILTMTGKL